MTRHQYSLEPYSGKRSRYTYPNCGDRHNCVRYVDPSGNPLHETVGRCNHGSSCGYHYTPASFFRDHPELKEDNWREVDWKEYHAGHGNCHSEREKRVEESHRHGRPDRPSPSLIPSEYLHHSIKPTIHSHFTTVLLTLFTEHQVQTLVQQYHLEVTKALYIIYFQIDINGNCRREKIMKYNSATGKRIKDPDAKYKINWVHSLLKKTGILDQSWQLTQCLFGEHLLSQYQDKAIALVVSEKPP